MEKLEVIIEKYDYVGCVVEEEKVIIEFNNIEEFVEKGLYLEFDNEEEVLEYYNEWFGGFSSVGEIVSMILEDKEILGEEWDNRYQIREDVFVRILD